jgi:hypothetical protein
VLRSNLSKIPEKSLIFLLHSGSTDGESRDSYWDKIFRRLLLGILFVILIPYISKVSVSHLIHTFMRIGICCNNTAFSSMEIMPKFYSFGYGFPFFNAVSSSSPGTSCFCSRRFMSCLFTRSLVRLLSKDRTLIPHRPDPRQPYHNLRHEEPPWQEFWRTAGMDGSGVGWYVSLHRRISKEEQTQSHPRAAMKTPVQMHILNNENTS